MSDIKHTPDIKWPWRYDQHKGAGEGYILNAEGNIVGQVRGWGWMQKQPEPEKFQDAHGHVLAASAELLKACRTMVAWSDAETAGPDYGTQDRDTHPDGELIWQRWWDDQYRLCQEAFDTARAAIAKAEGRS